MLRCMVLTGTRRKNFPKYMEKRWVACMYEERKRKVIEEGIEGEKKREEEEDKK